MPLLLQGSQRYLCEQLLSERYEHLSSSTVKSCLINLLQTRVSGSMVYGLAFSSSPMDRISLVSLIPSHLPLIEQSKKSADKALSDLEASASSFKTSAISPPPTPSKTSSAKRQSLLDTVSQAPSSEKTECNSSCLPPSAPSLQPSPKTNSKKPDAPLPLKSSSTKQPRQRQKKSSNSQAPNSGKRSTKAFTKTQTASNKLLRSRKTSYVVPPAPVSLSSLDTSSLPLELEMLSKQADSVLASLQDKKR